MNSFLAFPVISLTGFVDFLTDRGITERDQGVKPGVFNLRSMLICFSDRLRNKLGILSLYVDGRNRCKRTD